MNTLYIYVENSNVSNLEAMDDEQLKKHVYALELKEKYIDLINKHNNDITSQYPNAGFDIFNPQEINLDTNNILKLNTGIVCAMFDNNNNAKSYFLCPRSSICKTPLRLANSIGIIDSGYRGNIIGMFDVSLQTETFTMDKYSRLLQICSGNLDPFLVKLVDDIDELGITERGNGGFGSTGN